jgi:hypothetical protein
VFKVTLLQEATASLVAAEVEPVAVVPQEMAVAPAQASLAGGGVGQLTWKVCVREAVLSGSSKI